MSCFCQYDARAAGGEGFRTVLDLDKLKEAGWIVECSGKRYNLESPLPNRKRFRSTKDVVGFLKAENNYEQFIRCNCGERDQVEGDSETDEDYRPDTEEEAEISSAYEDTPIKGEGPHQSPNSPQHVAKR